MTLMLYCGLLNIGLMVETELRISSLHGQLPLCLNDVNVLNLLVKVVFFLNLFLSSLDIQVVMSK